MTWQVIHADCVQAMRELEESSVDAVVTDPPYEIAFMAREWDRRGVAFNPATWREAIRVLKPGGHLLSFGGTRTYHRLACALEDAGFEIRDCLAWLYGSGFPKSLDVSKAIDKAAGADAERWQGWGTALKPAFEPIVLARKPLSGTVAGNVSEYGVGALNVDGTRIAGAKTPAPTTRRESQPWFTTADADNLGGNDALGRWPANVLLDQAWVPVLRLRDSLSDDAWTLLSEWCDGRQGEVPELRGHNRRPAEPGEADEVLQSGVLVGVALEAAAGQASPHVRAEALVRVDREDARDEASDNEAGPGQSALEGLVHAPGVRDGEPAGGTGDPRASAGDGAGPRTTTRARRSRPSRQRDQVGQPTGEPESVDSGRPRPRAPSGLRRAPTAPRLRREVLLWSVPDPWLTYFEFTGDVARIGSAEILDEQSGETSHNPPAVWRRESGDAQRTRTSYTIPPAEAGTVRGGFGDRGGASRFFYTAKTSRAERERGVRDYGDSEYRERADVMSMNAHDHEGGIDGRGVPYKIAPVRNNHPTVKPVDLMQWLCRLITPPHGLVLDPFLGSGSTGIAALREGFDFIGIEREAEYVEIARARIIGDAPLFNAEEVTA